MPMNRPNKPPQLEMKSAVLDVSEQMSELKLCSSNDINILAVTLIRFIHKKQCFWWRSRFWSSHRQTIESKSNLPSFGCKIVFGLDEAFHFQHCAHFRVGIPWWSIVPFKFPVEKCWTLSNLQLVKDLLGTKNRMHPHCVRVKLGKQSDSHFGWLTVEKKMRLLFLRKFEYFDIIVAVGSKCIF